MAEKKRGLWLPKLRIRHKIIFVVYIVLFTALIFAEGFIYYNSYLKEMDETIERYQNVAHNVTDSVEFMERDMVDIINYFSISTEVRSVLTNPPAKDDLLLFWNDYSSMVVMHDVLAVKNPIQGFVLYPENGLPPYFHHQGAAVFNLDFNEVKQTEMYSSAVEAKGDIIWKLEKANEPRVFLNSNTDKVIVTRELFDLAKKKKLAFMLVAVDAKQYENYFADSVLYENETIVMQGGDGTVLAQYGNVPAELVDWLETQDPPPKSGHLQYEEWHIFPSYNKSSGATIFYISPNSNWNAWIKSGLVMPIILGFFLLILMGPLSMLASRIISSPLQKLHESMAKVKNGDFSQKVDTVGNDEISELAATFNQMVTDISELIDRNYVMVLREKESELEALQAKINPHFLYNTLDSLYWKAIGAGQDELAEDVISLSDLFRLLLSSGEGMIPVSKEIEIISNYLHIQKMRFSQRLDYDIKIDENVLGCHIPKLILQPFVENAIVHGLERKDSEGMVIIRGQKIDNMLVFNIEDNGLGMPKEKLRGILNNNEQDKDPYANQRIGHYAIRNVKERMALRYSDSAMLEMESNLGIGTMVRLTIPDMGKGG